MLGSRAARDRLLSKVRLVWLRVKDEVEPREREDKMAVLTVNIQRHLADDRGGHRRRHGPALEFRAPQRPRHLVDEQVVHGEFARGTVGNGVDYAVQYLPVLPPRYHGLRSP